VLALKNRVCPEFSVLNIYFLSFRNFEQLALAPKNRVPLKFFIVLNIFAFGIFEQLALALKKRVCPEFTVLNIYFLSFRIFEQLALVLKTEFAFFEFSKNFQVRGQQEVSCSSFSLETRLVF